MISGAPGPTRARDDDDDDDARGSTRVTGWSLQTIAAVVCARNEGILARGQAYSLVVDGISVVTRPSSSGESAVDVPQVSRWAR